MKSFVCASLLVLFTFCTVLPAQAQDGNADAGKILIVYFSWSGNTRRIASQVHAQIGGDLVEIEMVTPYSRAYNTCLEQSLADLRADARPALRTRITNMEQYDVIFLGYPTWWGTIPMPIKTFLESYDFSGKTILPFNSHGGSRQGQTISAIAKLCPNSLIKSPLGIRSGGGPALQRDIEVWLQKNGIPR
jgi:flavodoxin